ncbi:pentatricopeptide repeat-containing protein At2g33680 [Selaginella moellendorffii]|uniref:pentatricopeptide repeat-containing protein At2g33680 n=1 Tax=Selaginella moellendorffii TaxID=88036 RepID=UPI000D1CDDDA|nr:pentatricopeptide repeat-containing protein At2g33680 [Selaginella moellendorffii]|eukprot:XP_024534869.1 pentatricopeptide repeat-containing protein At2g33680 [Selaginella moellendorffii]
MERASFEALLGQCSKTKALLRGRKAHEKLKAHGFHHETYMGNLLVQMYGSCGAPQDAALVFDSIAQRNVFSWNNLLAAYTHSWNLREADIIFRKMAQHSLVTYSTMITVKARAGSLEESRDLFDHLPESSLSSSTTMMITYGKKGNTSDAKQIFHATKNRDVVAWNAMLSALTQNEELEDAKLFLQRMPFYNVVTWTAIISGYIYSGNIGHAKAYFDNMPERSTITWNLMISAYAQCGDSCQCRRLFDKMPGRTAESWNSAMQALAKAGSVEEVAKMFELMPERDIVSWNVMLLASKQLKNAESLFASMPPGRDVVSGNIMLGAYAKAGRMDLADSFFARMPQHSSVSWNEMIQASAQLSDASYSSLLFAMIPERTVVTWTALLCLYAQNRCVEDARFFVFDKMPQRNLVTWNSMVAAYAQLGNPAEALELFKSMDLEGITPNEITFSTAIDACTTLHWFELGRIIHYDIVAAGVEPDAFLATALVSLYGRAGSLSTARALFERNPNKVVGSWNAMITSYADNGLAGEALELFSAMQIHGVDPDHVTFKSVLSACSHAGLLLHGVVNFGSIEMDFGVMRTGDHYECVIDLLSRSGMLQQAEELVAKMPFEPGCSAWRILLAACKSHGDAKRGEYLGKQVLELDEDGSSASPYIVLSSIHSQSAEVDRGLLETCSCE